MAHRHDGDADLRLARAWSTTDGTQTLQTRVVDKAGNASAVALRHRSAWTAPSRSTRPPRSPPAGARRTSPTTVTGTDATSGVQKIEWRVDGGVVSDDAPPVSVTADGSHKLETRVHRQRRQRRPTGAWTRSRSTRSPRPSPSTAARPACGATTPVDCSVTADGGVSGLPDADRRRAAAARRRRGRRALHGRRRRRLDAQLPRRRRRRQRGDRQGRRQGRPHGSGRHRHLHAGRRGRAYTCTPSASDAGSGLAAAGLLGQRRRAGADRQRRRVHGRQGHRRRHRDRRRRQRGHLRRRSRSPTARRRGRATHDDDDHAALDDRGRAPEAARRPPPRACSASSRCRRRRPRRPSTCARSRSARARSSS